MDIRALGIGFGIGLATGAAMAGAIFYVKVYRRYIPLNRLEERLSETAEEVDALLKNKADLAKEFKEDTDDYLKLKENMEDWLDQMKKEYEATKAAADYGDPWAAVARKDISDDDDISDEQGDELDDDPVDNGTDEPDRDNVYIHDGNPRWDGPLTDDEQRQYDEAAGDDGLQASILTTIKARRWHESIDEDEPYYQISEQEHDDAPEFIDTEHLDYWEDDDVLARGMEIVQDPDSIIDTIVLNHFGRHSQTDDPNVVFCRNDILETDYEITRHKGSYQHEVLGIPDNEAYRPTRRFDSEVAEELEEEDDR